MSYVHPPGDSAPVQPTPPEQAPPPRPHKQSPAPWIVGLLFAFGAGLVSGITVSGAAEESPTSSAGREPAAERPADPPEPDYYEPTPADFTLSVKTLEKRCFGSAGCNVVFQIEPTYSGGELDPSQTYRVVYEVTGGDDVHIGNMTVRGDQYSVEEQSHLGTPNSNATLEATVTDVSGA